MRLGQQASIVIQRDKQGQVVARAPAIGRHATGRTAQEALRSLGRWYLPDVSEEVMPQHPNVSSSQ